jgi:hypothetical protein
VLETSAAPAWSRVTYPTAPKRMRATASQRRSPRAPCRSRDRSSNGPRMGRYRSAAVGSPDRGGDGLAAAVAESPVQVQGPAL